MAPRISVICRNHGEDRIIPRMARALRDVNGWSLGAAPDPKADAVYLSAYFESQILKGWPAVPVAGYLTHREEDPPGNAKSKLFDQMAQRLDLRVVTCGLYADQVAQWGPTVQAAAPLERERFTPLPNPSPKGRGARVVGFSGYTYPNHRKGEDLVKALLSSKVGQRVEWRASGRGWPVPTKRYAWKDMPKFYQGLHVLVVPSRVEGIPMPPLEALACGVPVVVPREVGLLDELPDMPGIYRYDKGDPDSLLGAFTEAIESLGSVDREALREATRPYSVENWCRDIRLGMERLLDGIEPADGGLAETEARPADSLEPVTIAAPVERGTESRRGIYCVAFGGPARECAVRLIGSIKKHMPDIPVALCAAEPLGVGEDLFIEQPDSDVGGRRAKLKAYELSPAEWESVLYLDADTEVVAPIYRYFEWVEAGWEFVICKDPHLMDTMKSFERANNRTELAKVEKAAKTLNALQLNGGVWAFGRSERIAAFFRRWQEEWEVYAQRDQGALFRALYADPLRTLVLGSEWNTFPAYTRGITTAGLMHYPGDARRWRGLIPGRIDSPEAWHMSEQFEARRAAKRR